MVQKLCQNIHIFSIFSSSFQFFKDWKEIPALLGNTGGDPSRAAAWESQKNVSGLYYTRRRMAQPWRPLGCQTMV